MTARAIPDDFPPFFPSSSDRHICRLVGRERTWLNDAITDRNFNHAPPVVPGAPRRWNPNAAALFAVFSQLCSDGFHLKAAGHYVDQIAEKMAKDPGSEDCWCHGRGGRIVFAIPVRAIYLDLVERARREIPA